MKIETIFTIIYVLGYICGYYTIRHFARKYQDGVWEWNDIKWCFIMSFIWMITAPFFMYVLTFESKPLFTNKPPKWL